MERPEEIKIDWAEMPRGECNSCGKEMQRVKMIDNHNFCASCIDGEYRQQWKMYALYLEKRIDAEQAKELIALYYFQKALDFLKKYDERSHSELIRPAVDRAVEEINKLGILKVHTRFNQTTSKTKITIELCRPGLLIGKYGENIDALSKFTDCDIHIVETESVGWEIANLVYNVAGIIDY